MNAGTYQLYVTRIIVIGKRYKGSCWLDKANRLKAADCQRREVTQRWLCAYVVLRC